MLKECIEKILSLAKIDTINLTGNDGIPRTYTSAPLVPVKSPLDADMHVNTLTGFMDLLTARINGFHMSECIVKVTDHKHVHLTSLRCDSWGARQCHIIATLPDLGGFRFGEFLPQEQFVIALQAWFLPTADREHILRLVSSITTDAVSISEDDGISQKATTRAGVSLVKEETIKRTVTLQPYRTFREVEQPESAFIFRVRGKQGEQPTCALFEADGGAWTQEATQRIKNWIEARNPGMPVIA